MEVDTFPIPIPGFEIQNRGHLPMIDERLSKEVIKLRHNQHSAKKKLRHDHHVVSMIIFSPQKKRNILKKSCCVYFCFWKCMNIIGCLCDANFLFYFIYFIEFQFVTFAYLIFVFYHQIKISISFWCK